MENLLVVKFGGTSVGNAERIAATAQLIAEPARAGRPVIAVVSAMWGVTDLLLLAARAAAAGRTEELEQNLARLRTRHSEAAALLLDDERREAFEATALQIIGQVENTCEGISRLGHCSARAMDAVTGCGEKLSALLVASLLDQSGQKARALDATALVVTDANFGEAAPMLEATAVRLRESVLPLLDAGVVPVITGFIGATAEGAPTTLGRGGSDYSAAVVAACLDAAEVIIWTDVEGVYSADPNLVPGARVLPCITYQEAAELSYYGAKVLHPKTLAPLSERGIPVWTKSSFRPESPGTLIASREALPVRGVPPCGIRGATAGECLPRRPEPGVALPHPARRDASGEVAAAADPGEGARAVTALKQAVLVTLESTGQLSVLSIMARALSVLAHERIDLLMLSQASREESFCFAVAARDAAEVRGLIENAFALELAHGYVRPLRLQSDIAILALIGSGMRGKVGIAGKLFGALSSENVNIVAIAQGATETNISVAVDEAALVAAVRAVHRALLEEHEGELAASSSALNCS